MLFYGAILCWTTYSCQNKRQNALFWARKLKKFGGRGHSPRPHPYWGGGHPISTSPSALSAPRSIFANPPVIFSQFSHWSNQNDNRQIKAYSKHWLLVWLYSNLRQYIKCWEKAVHFKWYDEWVPPINQSKWIYKPTSARCYIVLANRNRTAKRTVAYTENDDV